MKLSKSARTHIRREKGRIRREVSDISEQTKQIDEVYKKFVKSSVAKPAAKGESAVQKTSLVKTNKNEAKPILSHR